MAALSTQLIGGLSETIQAWEGFRITDANYFLFDEVPTAEPSLEAPLNAIDKEFSKLKPGLRKLEQLKKELCDRREGVSHPQVSPYRGLINVTAQCLSESRWTRRCQAAPGSHCSRYSKFPRKVSYLGSMSNHMFPIHRYSLLY